ncbi:hypothetical protein OIU79_026734 [Salix purpurea]|uniref:Uncharacterized protein n=1 Tax=Salix purpurea TaxID=77065 RepID=A0A9Q1A103_SALPP|nr:hypothetical protein OIU79_026734 [Salix purpurea]
MEERQATPAMAILAESSSSPSGGLACAIAALAERQQTGGESISSSNVLPDSRMIVSRDDGEWGADRGSDAAEAGTSYASSESAEDADGISFVLPPPPPSFVLPPPPPPPLPHVIASFQNVSEPVPESFEEQMMLAMAVSLAEARAMASEPQSAWQ